MSIALLSVKEQTECHETFSVFHHYMTQTYSQNEPNKGAQFGQILANEDITLKGLYFWIYDESGYDPSSLKAGYSTKENV